MPFVFGLRPEPQSVEIVANFLYRQLVPEQPLYVVNVECDRGRRADIFAEGMRGIGNCALRREQMRGAPLLPGPLMPSPATFHDASSPPFADPDARSSVARARPRSWRSRAESRWLYR